MSEAVLGEIAKLLVLATITAIRSGQEFIDSALLRKLDWVPPSE